MGVVSMGTWPVEEWPKRERDKKPQACHEETNDQDELETAEARVKKSELEVWLSGVGIRTILAVYL